VLWFRRDLRLADHPALLAAVEQARAGDDEVVALFVVDPVLWRGPGAPRRAYLARSLAALDDQLDGRLVVRHGDPARVVPALAHGVGAPAVHVTAATEPYGRRRDDAVAQALGGVPLVRTGSPYAVGPGRVRTRTGGPYQVFGAFRTAWLDHGWPAPAPPPHSVGWATMASEGVPAEPADVPITLPAAGEHAAYERWVRFRDTDLPRYAEDRDRPDLDATSAMSVPLKYGEIHPRTLLADLVGPSIAVASFRSELAWREFHADVLWNHPSARTQSLRAVAPDDSWASGEDERARLAAWAAGRTGYPFVDAGMRQLLATGAMAGRVRMVVASFLVKDLHVHWQRGAAHFLDLLLDGDVASNQLNWQWVAGTGRDAAPYFRVFNPVTQGLRFDPHGDYVRRWVPELRGVPGAAVHQPWALGPATPAGYPPRLVDHAAERLVALEAHRRVGG